jgi:hypothetical protein
MWTTLAGPMDQKNKFMAYNYWYRLGVVKWREHLQMKFLPRLNFFLPNDEREMKRMKGYKKKWSDSYWCQKKGARFHITEIAKLMAWWV